MKKIHKKFRNDGNGFINIDVLITIFIILAAIFVMWLMPGTIVVYNEDFESISYGEVEASLVRGDILDKRGLLTEWSDTGYDMVKVTVESGNCEISINGVYIFTMSYQRSASINSESYPEILNSETTITIKNMVTGITETHNMNWVLRGA